MLFKTLSAAVFGFDAYLVEVDVVPAFQGFFTVVGLPDIAVKENRERIRAALRNCGFDFPSGHAVTINLALGRHSQGTLGVRSAHGAGTRGLPGKFRRQNSRYARSFAAT